MSESKIASFTKIREAMPGNTFTIAFTGDCCPRGWTEKELNQDHVKKSFSEVKAFLSDADIRIMQWETPLSMKEAPIPKSGPNLICPPQSVLIMKELDINIALLANNHIGDQDQNNVIDTIRHINEAGIKTVGAGTNLTEANAPLEFNVVGKKITLINCAENEFGIAEANKAGASPLDPFKNIKAIKSAKAKSDFVIVAIHGGHEFYPLPSPRMVELYREFADAGADLVFNCHTHCPGPVEVCNGTPIVYSPGNFFFPYCPEGLPEVWYSGYIPVFHFDSEGVYAYEIRPFRFDDAQMYKLNGEQEELFFSCLSEMSDVINDQTLLQKSFDAWCLEFGGAQYLKGMLSASGKISMGDKARTTNQMWLDIKNIFNCESHNDLLTRELKLILAGETNVDPEISDRIKNFQNAPWIK